MLSALTVNIGAAAQARAESLLGWLSTRDESVLILTETSTGPGTEYLLKQYTCAGFHVARSELEAGQRGVAIVSGIPLTTTVSHPLRETTIPARVCVAQLQTTPAIDVIGLYAPTHDLSFEKLEAKRAFLSSVVDGLAALPAASAAMTLIGGDYNVIGREHEPAHRGFLPFEVGFLDALRDLKLADLHRRCHPGVQAHSWFDRQGSGYRFDYFHAGMGLADHAVSSEYLQEIRERGLTDHAAVSVNLDVPVATYLSTTDPVEPEAPGLF